jgi:CheY-like chemotaxis protein
MPAELVRILLVEDNPADVYLFRLALDAAGLNYELTVIADGAEALAFVQGEGKHASNPPPDLVVLDINLPKSDGIQVLRAIRRNERFANIPVVITSSSPSLPPRAAAEQLDFARYIRKPPDLEDFLRIGEVLKDVLLQSKAPSSSPHDQA